MVFSCNRADFSAVFPNEPFLSGIGRNSGKANPHYALAPRDARRRLDDAGPQDNITFGARPFGGTPGLKHSNVAYLVHDTCWQLLRQQAEFRGVADITAPRYTKFLYMLHHSTSNGLGHDWAGDYGGLLHASGMGLSILCWLTMLIILLPSGQMTTPAVNNATYYPRFIDAIVALVARVQDGGVVPIQEEPIFGQRRDSWKREAYSASQFPPITGDSKASLHDLPTEIILEIARHLPTPHLFNFWIAYAGVPDYFPWEFWRSRFDHDMELGHLFEVRDLYDIKGIHWYTIFRKVKAISYPDDTRPMHNRRRILTVADQLIALVKKYVGRPVKGTAVTAVNPILFDSEGYAAYQVQLELPPPEKIRTFHVSTIQLGLQRYVTGIRINEEASGLGYCHIYPSETLQVDVAANDFVQMIGWYMDSMGVCGLYLVTEHGRKLDMELEPNSVGKLSHGQLPMGERLIGHFDVRAVFSFSFVLVCEMVSADGHRSGNENGCYWCRQER